MILPRFAGDGEVGDMESTSLASSPRDMPESTFCTANSASEVVSKKGTCCSCVSSPMSFLERRIVELVWTLADSVSRVRS